MLAGGPWCHVAPTGRSVSAGTMENAAELKFRKVCACADCSVLLEFPP